MDPEAHDDDTRLKPDGETASRFVRIAPAVLDRVGADLLGTPFSVVIADELARVIEHADGNVTLGSQVEEELALVARGGEALMRTVGDLAGSAGPLFDPRSGRP